MIEYKIFSPSEKLNIYKNKKIIPFSILVLLIVIPISGYVHLKNNIILELLPIGSFIPSFSLSTFNGDAFSSFGLFGKKYSN